MLFWIICVAMVLLVLAVVLRPMLTSPPPAEAAPDVAIYRAQLEEIDRDLARDVLAADEAERARTEVARRLLAATDATSRAGDAPVGLTRGVITVTGLAALVLSVVSYLGVGAPGEPDQPLAQRLANAEVMRAERPDQAALEAAAPALPPVEAPADYLASVEELRRLMAERPTDLQGHELLAFHEAELRNFAAAADTQAVVIALKGEDAVLEDRRILLDLMVTAADGIVSPEAEVVAREILREDEDNVAARFYIGALYAQTARPDLAFRLWRPLVESGEETFHTTLARAQIERVAELSGVTYTPPEVRGPSLSDIEAAEDLSPEDRQAMIAGMVAGLADRLATQGGGPADWARLIAAYGVLGETEAAAEVWAEARGVFGADAGAMDMLREAAQSAGVLDE